MVAAALGLTACGTDPLQGAGFTSVAMSRSDPSVIYAAANSPVESVGIYRSDDGGETWAPTPGTWWNAITSGEPFHLKVTSVAVSPDSADVVLIATGQNDVFRTTNGGRSWTQVGDSTTFGAGGELAVSFHPGRPGWAYAVSSEEPLSVSMDGGQSWQVPADPAPPAFKLSWCSGLAFDAARADRMYAVCSDGIAVSDDSGMSWNMASGLPTEGSAIVTLVASPTEGDRLWAASEDGVWASTDGASSFVKLTDWAAVASWPDAPHGALVSVASGAYSDTGTYPLLIFGTTGTGVVSVRPDDGTIADLGASLVRRAATIDAVVVSPGGELFLGAEATCRGLGGVFRSDDRGATWAGALVGSPYPPTNHSIGIPVPHEVEVIFFRDVPQARQQEIMQEHNVTPEFPSVSGPLLWWLRTADDDPRSVDDLLREFGALDEVDCVLNDNYLSER